jgi:lysozyme
MNENLRTMLIRHEGYEFVPYKCPAGYRTIGVGHNYDANPLPKDMQKYLDLYACITAKMVERLLEADCHIAEEACKRLYPCFDEFIQERQDALVDFLFNVGEGTAKTFKQTNKAINEGRWGDAAKGIRASAYYKQVGKRGEEIARMLEGTNQVEVVVVEEDQVGRVGAI